MSENLFLDRFEAARAKRLESKYPGNTDPEVFTIGDLMSTIWSVEDEADMRPFFDGYVTYLKGRPDCDDAEGTARSNIGWMFGEGMSSERIEQWARVTQSSHPVFGGMIGKLSPEAMIDLGRQAARKN